MVRGGGPGESPAGQGQNSKIGRDIRELMANGLGGAASAAALEIALGIMALEGVSGVLVVKIPSQSAKPIDMHFTVGRAHVTLDQQT